MNSTALRTLLGLAWFKKQKQKTKSKVEILLVGVESSRMSLESKPTSPRKCFVIGSRTVLFFDWLKNKLPKQKLV